MLTKENRMSAGNNFVVLTGIGGLLGQVLSTRFIENEYRLIGISRTPIDKLPEYTQNLISEEQIIYYQGDITDLGKLDSIMREIADFEIVGLINNAGVMGNACEFVNSDIDEWLKEVDINLLGPIKTTYALLKHVKTVKYIVNMSGGGATKPSPFFSSYATAKTGLIRFTDTLAKELTKQRIKCLAVAPGFLSSQFHHQVLSGSTSIPNNLYKSIKEKFENPDDPTDAAKLILNFILGHHDNLNGKLISATYDPTEALSKISEEDTFGSLRRIDDIFYQEIK